MNNGKCYRLLTDTLGISQLQDRRQVITVPAGNVIRIVSGPRPQSNRMVYVTWNEVTLEMFADDVLTRGEELPSRQMTA
jgi:hypothetical protein